MYRYDVKLRIAGEVTNEVRKRNVSAAEIIILRRLHGKDAVVDIVEKKNDNSEHDAERDRLREMYVSKRSVEHRSKLNFDQMFGPEFTPLPVRLPEFATGAAKAKARQAAIEAGEDPDAPKGPELSGRSLKNAPKKQPLAADEVDVSAVAG